ncbi:MULTISPECIES: DUF945 family protein [unclassified Acinetobacter]|uniref:DUF945 family protein n=1 Tax=unclassified Acinetobacter TaxID=196816 RepID=UPI0015D2C4F8|nr:MULTISPECIES: DUF945 family protein [unclassified Acinetobacter]
MSKLMWGIGSLVVLSAAVVGGNLYADKSLSQFYTQKNWSAAVQDVDVKYSNYQMGLMGGTVDWVLTLKTDPCKPKEVIVLKGTDQIQRGLKGYNINSNFKIVQQQSTSEYAKLFGTDLTAKTLVNWIGQSKTDLQIPAFKTTAQGATVQADASQLQIRISSLPGQATKVSELSIHLPVVRLSEGPMQTMVQNFSMKTNQGLNQKNLENGFVEIQAASIKRLDQKFSGGMRGMQLRWEIELNKHDVDFEGYLKADEMDFPGSPVTKDFALNLALHKVNLDKVRAFSELLHQVENSCDAVGESSEEMIQAFLAIASQGFDFESKDNSISIGGGKASANVVGKVMPGHHASMESFIKMVPSLLDFQADLSFDKNMMTAIMNNFLQLQGKSLSGQEAEAMFAGFETSGQGKRDGNNMVMSMQYKFGQKLFGQAIQKK